MEDNFALGCGWGDDFKVTQTYCIDSAIHFYYYYGSSTSDHQALDPRGLWTPALGNNVPHGSPHEGSLLL